MEEEVKTIGGKVIPLKLIKEWLAFVEEDIPDPCVINGGTRDSKKMREALKKYSQPEGYGTHND